MERPTCLHSIFSGDDKTLERHPPCQVISILKPSMLGDHVYSEAHLSWCLLDFLCQHLKYTYINVHIMGRTQVYKKQSADTDSRSVTCTGNSEETRCKLQCLLDYVPVEKDLIWDSSFFITNTWHQGWEASLLMQRLTVSVLETSGGRLELLQMWPEVVSSSSLSSFLVRFPKLETQPTCFMEVGEPYVMILVNLLHHMSWQIMNVSECPIEFRTFVNPILTMSWFWEHFIHQPFTYTSLTPEKGFIPHHPHPSYIEKCRGAKNWERATTLQWEIFCSLLVVTETARESLSLQGWIMMGMVINQWLWCCRDNEGWLRWWRWWWWWWCFCAVRRQLCGRARGWDSSAWWVQSR